MSENSAKISISVSEGKFEISGSEKFVSEQIENFKDLITKSVSNIPKKETVVREHSQNHSGSTSQEIPSKKENKSLDNYDEIYVEDEEVLKIICDIPGSSTSKKTLNAALLYAYGKKLQGDEVADVEEIREVCRNHGIFDSKNFSTVIKGGDPQLYIDKKNGDKRIIKLNRPGIKAVTELIQTIQNE